MTVNKANFSKYLKLTEKQDGTVAERIQNMLTFGLAHYEESGDSRYLAAVQNGNFKAARREAFRSFIVAHSNLKCVRTDPQDLKSPLKYVVDPKSKVKVAKGKQGGVKAITINPETKEAHTWWTFTPEKINVAFDIDSRIKALIGQAKAAIEGKDGRKVKGTKAHAREQLQALEALIA